MKLKYFLVCFVVFFLVFFVYFKNQLEIHNHLGEKLFLSLYQNRLAIFVLENFEQKNYYTYFLLGRIYFVENNLNLSIKNYTTAINLEPFDVKSYYGRGLAYGFHQPQIFLSLAEADFMKVLEIYQKYPEIYKKNEYGAWAVYNDLAWIYFLKGNFQKQEIVARQGMENARDNPWLNNMLGVALLAQNKCESAKVHFNYAKKMLENISVEKFGEAYSGDNKKYWKKGKEDMMRSIEENLQLCENK